MSQAYAPRSHHGNRDLVAPGFAMDEAAGQLPRETPLMMIYGLSTCALCQRARKALEGAGHAVSFRDVRAEPLSEVELTDLITEFGDRLVDRGTNDYRALSAWLKNSEAEAQIAAQPKVMARPVIHTGDTWHVGWDDAVEAAVLRG